MDTSQTLETPLGFMDTSLHCHRIQALGSRVLGFWGCEFAGTAVTVDVAGCGP